MTSYFKAVSQEYTAIVKFLCPLWEAPPNASTKGLKSKPDEELHLGLICYLLPLFVRTFFSCDSFLSRQLLLQNFRLFVSNFFPVNRSLIQNRQDTKHLNNPNFESNWQSHKS